MIGSTSRCALTVQNPAYGLCSQGVNGVNSDVVMILHLEPGEQHAVDPVDPARPLRPERAVRRGQQDRCGAVSRSRSADRRHRRGLRDPDPALRRAELRQLHQRRERVWAGSRCTSPSRCYDAYSGLNIQTTGCLAAQRDAGAPGRTRPSPPVQAARGDDDRPRLLAPGGAERPGPHPPGPRVPARAGDGGQGQGPQQPDHRPVTDFRRRGRPHRRHGLLGHRHDRPRAQLPRRQRQQGAAADAAGAGRPTSATTCTRGAATGTSSSRPSRRTTARSTSSSA